MSPDALPSRACGGMLIAAGEKASMGSRCVITAEEHESLAQQVRRAAMNNWWAATTLVDRLYFGYFLGLGAAIAAMGPPSWPDFLLLHAVAMLALGVLIIASRNSQLARFLHDWYPLGAFIVCFEEIARLSFLFAPHWQDAYLLDLEARIFAVPPTEWLSRLASPLVTEALEFGYFSYFLLLIIVGGVLYRRDDDRPFRRIMAASVISYFICYLVYLVWPTEGPGHTLAATEVARNGGVFHSLVLLIQRHAGVHGNAFPSSHVAAGVVALVFAWRYAPRLGAWLTPVVALLCVGAVYDGYHYVSDVVAGIAVGFVVALPFAHRAIGNGESANANC